MIELSTQHQIVRLAHDQEEEASLEQKLKLATEMGIPTSVVVTAHGLGVVETPPASDEEQLGDDDRNDSMLRARAALAEVQDGRSSDHLTPGTGSTLVDSSSDQQTAASGAFDSGEGSETMKGHPTAELVDRELQL